jgi:hypothetical protein
VIDRGAGITGLIGSAITGVVEGVRSARRSTVVIGS